MKYRFLALLSIFCLCLGAQDLSSKMTVTAGTSMIIKSGTTLDATELNLKSTSNRFATVLDETGSISSGTVVNYDRYVNVVGSGAGGGNDLISLPVKAVDANFGDFLAYNTDGTATTANSEYMPTSGTLYAFGPYSNVQKAYINYDTATDLAVSLERAVGYRAATNSGQTLRFTGTISTGTETVSITTVDDYKWNSVGNPYPTYIDSQAFLTANESNLDPASTAIYAYNNGASSGPGTIGDFTIINYLTNTALNIAPGQGFLLANAGTTTHDISFTPAMRLFSGSDDFIAGRVENTHQMLRLKAEHANADFATEIYFNNFSTQGLDLGYDAKLFRESSLSFSLYSHLVEDNEGASMAIQSLETLNGEVIIPLGLKVEEGEQVKFSIENSTLSSDIEIYLEDNLTNTFTLLNDANYTFVTNTALSGTGRFYLRIGNVSLSQINKELNSLNLYTANQKIFVKGQLLQATQMGVYDSLGRLVMRSSLETGSNTNEIDVAHLSTGIYIVKLTNGKQKLTQKVILK
ncbi:T9SS type A sorting domain-containing protein [Winogradskyella bathintestinalis]|uniref:T9SS type A sorting domain-containing protein n=1 Tax=Winogradskyella bathintestinalis TaxID=3035208 RepID=A0ABT7ZR37_9FLAO|nr:T9SS type A sorting domain-containing protein [Winogradskyella bathintestinalis]MDN3491447.1 T9SS type A sorting domain-containing protein [Winogradskyella bathintestinalis]